jgi:hypothetical protein
MRAHVPFVAALSVLIAIAASAPRDARAQDVQKLSEHPSGTDFSDLLINRKHTVAELEAGILALPTAPISAGQRGGDTPFGTIGKGDATLQTGVHLLYRGGRDWAIGAGGLFAPQPTSDDLPPALSGLRRSHSRSYLFLGTEGRYIPVHWRTLEGWFGFTIGGIIIADRYTTKSPEQVPSILGTKEVTIRTEGFAAGIQAGADWMFAERLVAGIALRLDKWLLPDTPRCSPIGDCSTLTGPVDAVELGLKIGYRLPL